MPPESTVSVQAILRAQDDKLDFVLLGHAQGEWRRHFQAADCEILEYTRRPARLEFSSWVADSRTPPAKAAMIRALQREAPREARAVLATKADGAFTLQTALPWGRLAC